MILLVDLFIIKNICEFFIQRNHTIVGKQNWSIFGVNFQLVYKIELLLEYFWAKLYFLIKVYFEMQ